MFSVLIVPPASPTEPRINRFAYRQQIEFIVEKAV